MADPVTLEGPSDMPLEPPVIDGDRVVWMEEPNKLDPNLPNRLLTERIGDDEATLIAEKVQPLSYAVGGDLVVHTDLATATLFAHRISTGEVVTVYDPGGNTNARSRSPVTDGRHVVWLERVPAPSGQRVEHRIRGFDIETGATFEVADPGIMSPSLGLVLNDGLLAWLSHNLEGIDTIHAVPVQSMDTSG